MSQRTCNWMIGLSVFLMLGAGCAREATEKVAEAGRDIDDAWKAEKNAAVRLMTQSVDASARQIEEMRAKAAAFEQAAANDAARAWRRMADGLEAERVAAARDLQAAEGAAKEVWEGAHTAAKAATQRLERAGKRAAALTAETKDEFVAEARAIVAEGEQELTWARAQLAAASDATRKDWQTLVADLEARQKRAAAELHRIEAADASALAELRHGFVAAYHDLADASKRARQRLAEA